MDAVKVAPTCCGEVAQWTVITAKLQYWYCKTCKQEVVEGSPVTISQLSQLGPGKLLAAIQMQQAGFGKAQVLWQGGVSMAPIQLPHPFTAVPTTASPYSQATPQFPAIDDEVISPHVRGRVTSFDSGSLKVGVAWSDGYNGNHPLRDFTWDTAENAWRF